MFHPQRPRCPFIVMRVALRIEYFDDGRDGSHGHHDQVGQTIPVNSDEELSRRPVKRKQRKDRTVLTVVRAT